MPRVRMTNFSTFYDVQNRVQFSPVLDKRSGCFVAVAEMDDEPAAKYEGNERFEVIDDTEFLAMVSNPKQAEPSEPNTGDPLSDAAGQSFLSAPKAPRSK